MRLPSLRGILAAVAKPAPAPPLPAVEDLLVRVNPALVPMWQLRQYSTSGLAILLRALLIEVLEIRSELAAMRLATLQPGPFAIHKQVEETMKWGLTFTLPGPSSADVTQQEFSASDNQGTVIAATLYPSSATQTDQFLFPKVDGLSVTAQVVDIDAAGNRSQPRQEVFAVVDNIAPPEPGDFGIAAQVEVDDSAPAASGT